MADEIRALIVENAAQTNHRKHGFGWFLNSRVFLQILDALEAARVPATNDELEALRAEARDASKYWEHHGKLGTASLLDRLAATLEPSRLPASDDERETLSAAVGRVLSDVGNFPKKAQSRLLGQSMASLRQKIVESVEAAGFPRSAQVPATDDWQSNPPPGWFVFGTHVDAPSGLEFWGSDDGGMPIWERPVAPATDDEREALAAELSKHWSNMNGKCACGWVHPQCGARLLDAKHFVDHCADALAAAGFCRFSRVLGAAEFDAPIAVITDRGAPAESSDASRHPAIDELSRAMAEAWAEHYRPGMSSNEARAFQEGFRRGRAPHPLSGGAA